MRPGARSRVFEYTYAALQLNFVLNDIGRSPTVNCALRERRSDVCAMTAAKSCADRASRIEIAPVDGTTLDCETYTGREDSSLSANRCVPAKFRSIIPA